ncbi:MAG: methionyl-tRNA formyltransferase [Desulfovibrio sp.]|jgi:methionyl-tRNA formyltransferase|nr:methionyl-tRNA formyltransferase [Desulfovibrio sp.]
MADQQKRRLIFMGTPDFAARVLQRIAEWSFGEIVAIYTQPDSPSGRGQKLLPPPVAVLARELGLPIFQPASLNPLQVQQEFAALRPDFLLTAAYGLILPDAVLTAPRFPPLNVHPSLLPRYRGAAPVQRSIMENWQTDARIGVSVIRIISRLDAGPVYTTSHVAVADRTAGNLLALLAEDGATLLLRVVKEILAGTANSLPQDEALATYAPKISKDDGLVDWHRPALAVHAHIRAMTPCPGGRAVFRIVAQPSSAPLSASQGGKFETALSTSQTREWPLLLLPGRPGTSCEGHAAGTMIRTRDSLSVACEDCWYELLEVRPQGAFTMPVRDFINGRLRGLPLGLCGSACCNTA